jgi:hypothetical protein
MVYECQDCGEAKKVFDLITSPLSWETPTDRVTEEKEKKEQQP